ncbi:NAD(P)-binding domain-containing protein [Solwaraspora sp. WMMD1047]|uniref:NADPH-dependent F420 reductase n=1 Tax=Solwaraspora sp. WMMD1047 TaxID=3016102 RepID=UPI002416CFC9|nr:NAD(P)-binding domain-containing protein [Solwaraspora sp. WMMD1047]MDG4833749.1 NAD(P)-binding domain-containing protein [Solwaraspora sp. WMMD1047]
MRIGVIGAGQVGAALARLFVEAGHQVGIANSRGPETLRWLVDELGELLHPVAAQEAAGYGDLVVVAVPVGRYDELPTGGVPGRTVIDTGNYYPQRDGHLPALDADRTTSSELLQARLPDARVVKAFNAIRAHHLVEYGRQSSAMWRYGIPVSGDDPTAKRRVFDLVEQVGFEPVDAGGLADGGRRHQPGSPVYGVDLPGDELAARLARPVRAAPAGRWPDGSPPPS